MAPAAEVLRLLDVYKTQIGLVNQDRRLQRLPRLLARKLGGGELAQLVVDQRQKLLRRR